MLVLFRSFVRLNLLPATTTPRVYKPDVNLFKTKSAVCIPCFLRLNLLPATTTHRVYKPYVNLFKTKSAVYIPCFLRLNLPPSYNPPLCLQTLCNFCYDKNCRVNPMPFTPKSGSQLQPRPSAYKPRHCAYKTLPLCLTVWRAEGSSYGTSIDASRYKETCAILLSKRLSHVGCSGRVINHA